MFNQDYKEMLQCLADEAVIFPMPFPKLKRCSVVDSVGLAGEVGRNRVPR